MPTYKFRNNQTGEEWDEFFTSSSVKDELLKEYPHVQQVPTSFGIVSTTGTIDGKTDLSISVDHEKLFESCGWGVLKIDGHNPKEIHKGPSPFLLREDYSHMDFLLLLRFF